MNRFYIGLLVMVLVAASLAGCATSTTTVVMTRHAEKATGNDPEQTPAGHARALALADLAHRRNVTSIISTQFRRTRQTAAPAARRLGITVEIEPASSPIETHIANLADRIRTNHTGETILVVGHSNTIPLLIAALGGPEVEIDEKDYGDVFILTLRNGTLIEYEQTQIGD